jgi:hypothetical protein
MHYIDKVHTDGSREWKNGVEQPGNDKSAYWREVIFSSQDDTVPDTFYDRYAREDALAELRWGRVRYRWYPPKHWGDKQTEGMWRVDEIHLEGYFLKKDGTPGQRNAGRNYYLNDDTTSSPYKTPDWLRQIVADHHPVDGRYPFPVTPT